MATLEETLKTHHTALVRVQFLDDDQVTVLAEATGAELDTSVTMDGRDVHRTASVSLAAEGDTYRPRSPASLVWHNRIVGIDYGALVNGVAQYVRVVTGLIDEIEEAEESAVVSFTVLSRLSLADKQFGTPVTYQAGERVGVVIRAIAERAGFGTSDDLYDATSGGQTLAQAVTFDASANMLASMVRLAQDAGCDLYDTGDGVLTLRPFVDPSTLTPAWDFGDNTTLTSLRRSLKAIGVYNRQDVVGVGPDGYPVSGRAVVTNPDDPLYWTPANDRPAEEYHPLFPITQQMAVAIARQRLFGSALYEESIAASSSLVPLVKDRDVVRFAGAGVGDTFVLDSVTLPSRGTMSMITRRVRSLLAA